MKKFVKVYLPAYIPISEELAKRVWSFYGNDKMYSCQDMQEATDPCTKLSDEVDVLRSDYGQFLFKTEDF
jgi:hypothetical protein